MSIDGALPRSLADGDDDQLIREEPLLLDIAGHRLLTMRTPGADPALALGFLLSEGIIDRPSEVQGMDFVAGDYDADRPDQLTLHLAARRSARLGRLARTQEIRSSCGICGRKSLDQLLEDLSPLLPGVPGVARNLVQDLRLSFQQSQPLFARTGACHGAALFGADGTLWSSAEDVGRHNALDKAIGLAAPVHELSQGIAFLSGRAGFDLVLKCLRVRVAVILSISAPSASAFDLCQAAGATLIGFVRPDRYRVYLDASRLR